MAKATNVMKSTRVARVGNDTESGAPQREGGSYWGPNKGRHKNANAIATASIGIASPFARKRNTMAITGSAKTK